MKMWGVFLAAVFVGVTHLSPTGATGAVDPPSDVIFHTARGRPVEGGAAASATAIARTTGFTAFEPTLGVTSRGEVLFQGAHELDGPESELIGGAPDVIRSRDGGITWEEASPTIGDRNAHPFTSDPYLHIDPTTDRVFTIDWVPGYCSQVSYSDDAGETWSMAPLGCGGSDHQHLFTGPPSISTTAGYPNVVYLCAQSIPSAICSKSLDGGRTFVPTGTLPFLSISDVMDCGRLTGHGVVGKDGSIYMPTACDKPYLAVSRDEGATWDVVTVAEEASNDNHETAVGVDDRGNVYYFWMNADRMPVISVSRDEGETFTRQILIAPPALREASLPAIAVSPTGTVAAAYMGSTNAPPNRRDYSKATWSGYITLTRNALAAAPSFVTGVYGNRRDPFAIGECGPRRCQAAFDFIDVQIDKVGNAWASFADGCKKTSCIDFQGGPRRFGEGVLARLSLKP